jgi:putative ABC transport system permease protein
MDSRLYHQGMATNSIGWFEGMSKDIGYAVRVLRKNSGQTLVALISLALGIGATTAIFSVIYGVLISPYPYGRPNLIWAPLISDLARPQGGGFSGHQMRDYVELKRLPALADTMATRPEGRVLTGDHTPENFSAINVTANAFQFLEVPPLLGRTIEPSDIRSDGQPEPVIVLTVKAWQRLFDGSPSALGKKLVLNDQPFTVIGVMPSRFGWWTDDGGWIVLPEDARDTRNVFAIMRLKAGISPKVAEDQLQALHLRLAKERPNDFPKAGFTTSLQNYLDITTASGAMQSSLRLLFGAVGLLLLIACANVANLQLARATARAHEVAVRMSVGAGRSRLVRQLLTESVVLAAVGGVLGVLFAFGITKAIVALIPDSYVPNEARITINLYALLFCGCVSVATGILFGLVPALKCSRPDLVDALKDSGRSLSGAAQGNRTRSILVVAEVTLAVVLLIAASLTIRGFFELQNRDTGFQPNHVLVVNLQLSPNRYSTYDQRVSFAERLLASAHELPDVQAAAIGNGGLPFGGPRSNYSIEGQPQPNPTDIQLGLISAEYPLTMSVPLRAGRNLEAREVSRAEPVALVNEAASKLWPAGTSPIGGRIRVSLLEKPPANAPGPAHTSGVVTVVGIIADTRNEGLSNPPAPALYVPYTLVAPTGRTLAIKTGGNPRLLLNGLRERLKEIDPAQPMSRALTLEEIVGANIVQPRFNMALFTFFALLGLGLAAVGIYSLLSYSVGQRTREIGIRMALGARGGDVLGMILGMGGRLVLTGLILGVAVSVILVRALKSQVFQVPETDFVALSVAVAVLGVAALIACIVPAGRAARLDPMSALRHE